MKAPVARASFVARLLAAAVALLLAPTTALADDFAPPSGDDEPPRQNAQHFIGRVGAEAAYRQVFDIPVYGGGLVLSLGQESARVGGHVDMHFIDARSEHGLTVLDAGVTGTAEWLVGGGWRIGIGGGWTFFAIQRATDGTFVTSFGPLGLARLGYDFGQRTGPYVLVDFEGQLQNGALVWGPTLQIGTRF